MAVTTAISFWFLSLGLLVTAGPSCWPVRMYVGPSLKARLMRVFIPASILIAMFQGLLSSAADPWIVNPALRVAVAALVAVLIIIIIISLLANNLSAEIERGDRARMKAESTLKQSEARFRTLAETANDAIINIDHNGHIVFWNRAAELIFGYLASEVIGKPLDMVMPEGFHAAHQQGLQRVVLTGETHIIGTTVEVAGLRKDGREFPLELSLATWQVAGDVFFTGIASDITERKQAEEALRQSEAKLRALFAGMRDVVIVYDIDGRYIEIAPTNKANLYRPTDEMVGKKMHDILPKEQADYIVTKIRDSIRTGQVVYGEYTLQIDGKEIWFSSSVSRLSETTAVWVAHDITERKRAAGKLEEERILLRTLIDNLPDRIFVMDAQGRKLLSNIADWQASGGKRMEDVIGKTDLDTYPPELAEDYWALDKKVIDSGISIFNREEPGLDSGGSPVWVLSSKVALRDGQGKIVGLVGIGHDITVRKQAEQMLRESENRFRAIFEQAAIGVAEINSITGEFVRVNQKYCEISGYSHAEMLRMRFQEISHPDDLPGDLEQMQKLLDGETRSFTMEKRHIRSDQSIIWLNLTVSPLWAPGEQPDYHMAVIEDITERKRLEQEIRGLSLTDELTGLYNRRGFTLLAEQEMKLARRFKRSVSLFFGDVDNLKTINDTLGHTQGDLALVEVAAILKKSFREADIPARFGGDEFVVLAPDSSVENTEIMTNRLQAALERRNQQGDRPYQLTLSMGIAHYDPEAPCTVSELIAQADDLMYRQKQARKGKK